MKVILSNMCTSLVGMLNPELGYHLEHRKNGFFAVRNNTPAPPDGHWRFIVLCAELAQTGLYISDIEVTAGELDDALEEATNGRLQSPWAPRDAICNSKHVIALKKQLLL